MVAKPDVDKPSSRQKTLQFSLQISNCREHSTTAVPQISEKVSSSHQRSCLRSAVAAWHLSASSAATETFPKPSGSAWERAAQPELSLDSFRAWCPSISAHWRLQSGAYVGEKQRLPACHGSAPRTLCYCHHPGRWHQGPTWMENWGASAAEPPAFPAWRSSQVAPVPGWNWSYHGETAGMKWPHWRLPPYRISGGCSKADCNANFLTALQGCAYVRCWASLAAGPVPSPSGAGNPALSHQ